MKLTKLKQIIFNCTLNELTDQMPMDYKIVKKKLVICLILFLIGSFLICSSIATYFLGSDILKKKSSRI